MYLMRSFLAVTLVAGGLVMASPASAAPILTATSFSYDLKSSGTSSTLTAAGDGFDFTINTASLIGPLTINYGSPLFTTILQDSARQSSSGANYSQRHNLYRVAHSDFRQYQHRACRFGVDCWRAFHVHCGSAGPVSVHGMRGVRASPNL